MGEKEEELLKKNGNVGGCGGSVCVRRRGRVCVGGGRERRGEFTEVILLEAGSCEREGERDKQTVRRMW